MFQLNKLFFRFSDQNLSLTARRQSENGANCSMFGGANKAMCSGGTNRLQLSFSAPFLCFFLWTNKERKKRIFGRTKKERKETLDEQRKKENKCLIVLVYSDFFMILHKGITYPARSVSGIRIPSSRIPVIRNSIGHLACFVTRVPGTRNDVGPGPDFTYGESCPERKR